MVAGVVNALIPLIYFRKGINDELVAAMFMKLLDVGNFNSLGNQAEMDELITFN